MLRGSVSGGTKTNKNRTKESRNGFNLFDVASLDIILNIFSPSSVFAFSRSLSLTHLENFWWLSFPFFCFGKEFGDCVGGETKSEGIDKNGTLESMPCMRTRHGEPGYLKTKKLFQFKCLNIFNDVPNKNKIAKLLIIVHPKMYHQN